MLKRILVLFLGLIVVLGLIFAFGPKEPANTIVTFSGESIGEDIDAYLADRESAVANLRDGAQKQIVWHDGARKTKTEWALVYVHGFSATLEEVRPLPDLVAGSLGANLHFTRLTGHGADGEAMATASVKDWMNDVAEAIEVGRRIGDKVVVMSASTGGTLSSLAAAQPELVKNVKAMVMISPNFAVQAAGAEILTLPWARQVLPLIFGRDRTFEPSNEEHGKWWTTSYPNVALLPMQAAVSAASELPFETMAPSALFIFHPDDGVVKSSVTAEVAKRWGTFSGAKTTVHEVTDAEDPYKHVIAGRILSPSNSEPLAKITADWIKSL